MAIALYYRSIDTSTARLFDTLRGASALLVVLGHTAFYHFPGSPRLVRVLLNVVDVAVLMFFVISGFMITSSMLRQTCRHPQRQFNIFGFARHRLARLFPPLLLALLLAALSYAWLITLHPEYKTYWSVQQALATPLFLLDMGVGIPAAVVNKPLWSLSHEVWFYVTGALVFLALVSGQWSRTACCIALLAIGFWLATVAWFLGLLVWLCGALIARYYHWPPERDVQARQREGHRGLFAAGILCFLLILLWTLLESHKPGLEMYAMGFLLAVAVGALVNQSVAYDAQRNAAEGSQLQARLLAGQSVLSLIARPARLVAATAPFSYTLFVIHFPLLLVWFELNRKAYLPAMNSLVRAGVFMFLVIVLAKFVGAYVEKTSVRAR